MTAKVSIEERCFNVILVHLLINAAIDQHFLDIAFIEEERNKIKTFMKKVADGKMGARHINPKVAVFEQKFEETFKTKSSR